jgi:hypothetical protein
MIGELIYIPPQKGSYLLCSREIPIVIIRFLDKLHPRDVEPVEEFVQGFH